MLDKAIAAAAAKAKLTGLLAVATLAGAGGGAYVLAAGGLAPTTLVTTVAAHTPQASHSPDAGDDANADNNASRPHNHGWCVSQAAHNKNSAGGGHNHGWTVSRTAQSDCGKTGDGNKPANPGKSNLPHGQSKQVHGNHSD